MAEESYTDGWSWSDAWSFLKSELTPYSGRGWLVARMLIAASIMMLWIMVFRIPGAALGAYYTLLISRDNTRATLDNAITLIVSISAALAEVLIGAVLFSGSPTMHVLWVMGSLFVTFFLISAATQYSAATTFGFLVVSTIPVWDFPASTEQQVHATLYTALAITVAATVTVVVEMIFAALHSADQVKEGIDDRLLAVATVLRVFPASDRQAEAKVMQFSNIGTGQLRRYLERTADGTETYSRRAVVIGLAGRFVDLCAGLLVSRTSLALEDELRFKAIARHLDSIRIYRGLTEPLDREVDEGIDQGESTFVQLFESTLQLTDDALRQPVDMEKPRGRSGTTMRLFKRDAFKNPVHLTFALRGMAAAMICYILYHLFDWRGLSSSVATCMITALSTTGSSRQKQVLRIAGAITGGLFFAIAAQVFLLPYMDSITQFTLLFVAVTFFSSWIATSSPRISYYGVQVAFAFYLVQLRVFAPETRLTPARDNVFGIFLGLIVMWIVFDQSSSTSAAVEMKRTFIRSIRLLIQFMEARPEGSPGQYLSLVRRYRDTINETFGQTRSQADAVLFEFHRDRHKALELRRHIKAWQPELRTFFMLQITLVNMRLRSSDGKLSANAEQTQDLSAQTLEQMATAIDRSLDSASGSPGSPPKIMAKAEKLDKATGKAYDTDFLLARNSLAIAKDLYQQIQIPPAHGDYLESGSPQVAE